ncbi:MAG: hypothetical protein HFG27_04645 [Provencibacterium sp.]|nr:hypothetical protein [Provencibacterium sp.]
MKKTMKGLLRLLLEILCSTALVILIELFWHGMPLLGIPQAEEIMQVEISHAALQETLIFTDEENIRLARSCIGCLKYQPWSAGEGEAQISIRYMDKSGRIYEAAAGPDTVFYNGKAHLLREKDIFINIAEGLFFLDLIAAR